jgi:hypothetical protein
MATAGANERFAHRRCPSGGDVTSVDERRLTREDTLVRVAELGPAAPAHPQAPVRIGRRCRYNPLPVALTLWHT